ncbi:MAG: hypothetical protein ACRD1R_11250 [Acidobacteriota bacterium]
MEDRAGQQKGDLQELVVRSDNGAQPCSKRFVEYFGSVDIPGQYTGYNAPDDNACVERVLRTLKEEEIWLNQYESWAEAHAAVDAYVAGGRWQVTGGRWRVTGGGLVLGKWL